MALEKDLELLDDYLVNRMSEADKAAFEKKLDSDSSLRSEYNIQKQLIDGLQRARIAELKNMLSEIAVPAASSGGSALLGKLALSIVGASAIGIAIYFWFGNKQMDTASTATIKQEDVRQPALTTKPEIKASENTATITEPSATTTEKENIKETKKKSSAVTTQPTQPKLNVFDPTQEQGSENKAPENTVPSADQPVIAESHQSADVISNDRKYNFHYQFKDEKLVLYGSFEKNLYEILDFQSNNKQTIFLYYNSGYYLLDQTQEKPTPLKAINDPALLKKLKEYRENQ